MEFMKRENERRYKFRFAIERDVRYKMAEDGDVVAAGSGQTINMSSGGVAFATEQPVTPGAYVELSISWPVLLDASCPMRLIVFGRVLRSAGRKAVCSIDKYEFRTQSRIFLASSTPRTDSKLQRWVDGMRKETLKTHMAGA
jgi:PilZ domain